MSKLIPVKNLGIKNIMPGLAERGKIKIGSKGAKRTSGQGNEFQPPQKLDHFVITTTARDSTGNFARDEALHALFGDKPTELPVTLLYDDIHLNFQTRYACYLGKRLFCTGDGETAIQQLTPAKGDELATFGPVPCTCYRQEPTYTGKDKCKMNGTLSVIITGAEVIGGVWKLRTTSYNTIVGLLSAMALIKRISGGGLAGLPLWLTVTPKTVNDPIQGNQQTVYVVGLEYRGNVQALQAEGYQTLLLRKEHDMRVSDIEDEARRMITADPSSWAAPDNVDDELAEFYPVDPVDPVASTVDRLASLVDDLPPAPEETPPTIEQPEQPAPAPKPERKPRATAAKPVAKPQAKTPAPAPEKKTPPPKADLF